MMRMFRAFCFFLVLFLPTASSNSVTRRPKRKAQPGVSLIQAKQSVHKTIAVSHTTSDTTSSASHGTAFLASFIVMASGLAIYRRWSVPSDDELIKPTWKGVDAHYFDTTKPSCQGGAMKQVPPPEVVSRMSEAAQAGNVIQCQELISQYPRLVNETDVWGCTPLHIAAHAAREMVVRFLLDRRASVCVKDAMGETPLHFAARGGAVSCCAALLAARADVDVANIDNETPLISAGRSGHEATCELLMDNGASTKCYSDSEVPTLLTAILVRRMMDKPTRAWGDLNDHRPVAESWSGEGSDLANSEDACIRDDSPRLAQVVTSGRVAPSSEAPWRRRPATGPVKGDACANGE